jgi:hypothetical protein
MARFSLTAGWTALVCVSLHLLGTAANAQFKELGPAPFSPAVARQRIRTLLNQVEPANRQQTIDQLNSLVPWYRNIVDEELIAGWQKDGRDRLMLIMEPMADPHVATEVVAFSWHTRTDASLNPAYATLLGHLMARYPESGKEFLSDLLAPTPPRLSPVGEETVCRILIDMPDIGTWKRSAMQILPRYRETAERLLRQDRQGNDDDKRYRAEMWLAQLRGDRPGASDQSSGMRRRSAVTASDDNSGPLLRPAPGTVSPGPVAANRPTLAPPPQPAPASPAPSLIRPPAAAEAYSGPQSGTLECTGSPVPQNAEYVFRNLPPLKLQLDYDRRVWDARLAPGENQSQRLILKNTSSGPQKRCVVHWKVVP